MFDIGFSEIVVIAVVALIVIGPERLPKVARTVGHLLGRMQHYVNDVKSDISREMEIEDLRKLQESMQDTARSIEQSVSTEVDAATAMLNDMTVATADATANVASPPAGVTETAQTVAVAGKPAAAVIEPVTQLELGLETTNVTTHKPA